MPTIDDLRVTLRERADRCDDIEIAALATTDRAPAPAHRRMVAPLLAAAAVVAVVGAGAGLGAALHHGTGTPAGSAAVVPSTSPTWQFHIADVPGWTVSYDFAMWAPGRGGKPGAWQEGAMLTPADGKARISYSYEQDTGNGVYPGNGVIAAVRTGHAQAVTVNGQSGWWVPGTKVDTSDMTPGAVRDPWTAVTSSGDWQPHLVWKNPDGSWNGLMGTAGFQPETYDFDNTGAWKAMSRIAKAVSITDSGGPVTLPFVAHLGAQYRVSQIRSDPGAACGEWAADPSTTLLTICRVTPDQQHSARLGLSGGDDEQVVRRDLGDGTVLAVVLYGDARRDLVPADVLDSVDVSPELDDPSTWLPLGP